MFSACPEARNFVGPILLSVASFSFPSWAGTLPPVEPIAAHLLEVGAFMGVDINWHQSAQSITRAERSQTGVSTGAEQFWKPSYAGTLNAKADIGTLTSCAARASRSTPVNYDFSNEFGLGDLGYRQSRTLSTLDATCSVWINTAGGRMGVIGGLSATAVEQSSTYGKTITPTVDNQEGAVSTVAVREEEGSAFQWSMGMSYQNDFYKSGGYLLLTSALEPSLDGIETDTFTGFATPAASESTASTTLEPAHLDAGLNLTLSDRWSADAHLRIDFWNSAEPPERSPATSNDINPFFIGQPTERQVTLTGYLDYAVTPAVEMGLGAGFRTGVSDSYTDQALLPDANRLSGMVRGATTIGNLTIAAEAVGSISQASRDAYSSQVIAYDGARTFGGRLSLSHQF